MSKEFFYKEVKKYKSIMRDYIDQANDILDDSNIEFDIGEMVSCSTRKKII